MAGEDKILKKEQFEKYNNDLKDKLRWSGTKAQYDALATKEAYTTYYLTDTGQIIRNGTTYSDMGKFLPLTGGTLTGDVKISKTDPKFTLVGAGIIDQKDTATSNTKNKIEMDENGIDINNVIDPSFVGHGVKIKKNGSVEIWSSSATGAEVECLMDMSNDGKFTLNGDALIGTAIEAFFNRIYPVGITYVQYTDTDNPNTLFPGTTWDDITNTIVSSGCRYPAFSPLNVGTKLDQELPNIRGEMNATPCAAAGWIGNGAFGESGKWGDYGCGYGNNYANGHYIFNANKSNGIYKDGANVQPYTYTVKLWMRTA